MPEIELDDRIPTTFVNLLLVILSIIVVLSGLEFALILGAIDENPNPSYTVEAKGKPTIQPCGGSSAYTVSSKYGRTMTPNGSFMYRAAYSKDFDLYKANAEGFRDTYDSGSDKNVVVLGDSFTHGQLVEQNGTYSQIVDHWTPETSVQNYAIGGYGTASELYAYNKISKAKDHNLVIVGYYPGNDLRNNAHRGAYDQSKRPEYKLEEGKLVLESPPTPPENISNSQTRDNNSLQDVLKRHWAGYRFINSRLERFRGDDIPTGSTLRSDLRLTEALLNEIDTTAREQNAEVLIVLIAGARETRDDVSWKSPKAGKKMIKEQRTLIRSMARENPNVRVLDLKPRLENEISAGNRLYGIKKAEGKQKYEIRNGHLDDYGHRVVAQELYTTLRQMGYTPSKNLSSVENYGFVTNHNSCPV